MNPEEIRNAFFRLKLKSCYEQLLQKRRSFDIHKAAAIIGSNTPSLTISNPKLTTITQINETPHPSGATKKGKQQICYTNSGTFPSLVSTMKLGDRIEIPVLNTSKDMPKSFMNKTIQLDGNHFVDDVNVGLMIRLIIVDLTEDQGNLFRQAMMNIIECMHSINGQISVVLWQYMPMADDSSIAFMVQEITNRTIEPDFLLVMVAHYMFGCSF